LPFQKMMSGNTIVPRIFVSHSSHDNFEALAFKAWLVDEGWHPDDIFLDLHGIGAGERWKEALAKANERCEAVVLLASPESLKSTECRIEIHMAEDYGKEIIVAILYLLPSRCNLCPGHCVTSANLALAAIMIRVRSYAREL
jgi:hypothetical protein